MKKIKALPINKVVKSGNIVIQKIGHLFAFKKGLNNFTAYLTEKDFCDLIKCQRMMLSPLENSNG